MSQWLKTLTGCLCILTVLMHLVPKGKFSGYVRFYGSFLFLLVAAGPVWKMLAGDGGLERSLQLEFLRDGYDDLESSIAGIAELKNDRIREAYQGEIARQIRSLASAYGVAVSELRLSFDEEDEYRMTGVSFAVREGESGLSVQGENLYEGQDGGMSAQGSGMQGADAQAASDDDVEAVRREIASVYALDLSCIHIEREGQGDGKVD